MSELTRRQQELVDLLRDGWTLKHTALGTKPGWYITKGGESRDVNGHTANSLRKRSLIRRTSTINFRSLWELAES